MTIEFSEIGLQEDLGSFNLSLESIDMESVKKRTAKAFAKEMSEQVRLAIRAEDDITSPGMNSKYSRGPGPSLITGDAWKVTPDGNNKYILTPHPKVEKRATVLNYGYPGLITPDGDRPFQIMINGHPIYRWAVKGPDKTNYWRAAMRNLEASGEAKRIAEYELRAEIEEAF